MTPFRLGLTGSIGMGKSTTAGFFSAEGIPVWDADQAVHGLYARGGLAVQPMARLCPAALQDGAISRAALKDWIAQDPKALSRIEAVIHPLVAADRSEFLSRTRSDIVVLDIPLLFETGADRQMDATLLVTAPPALQRQRVLQRPGMSDELLAMLLAKQLPDRDKRACATHIIETLDLPSVEACAKALIAYIRKTRNA